MLTNHTQETLDKAKNLFKLYYPKHQEGDYVPYICPYSVLAFLGVEVFPIKYIEGGALMKIHNNDLTGYCIEVVEGTPHEESLLSLAAAHAYLGDSVFNTEAIVYYPYGTSSVGVFEQEMASIFARELFKHNSIDHN